MISAIIVDDEPYCSETLSTLLERYCPEVEVVAICNCGAGALKEIHEKKPALVFMDIEMPHINGFDVLGKIPEINFELIFTTSYDQYAIKAMHYSALDYLLKPIDRVELQKAVQKIVHGWHHFLPQQLEILMQKLHHPATRVCKIAMPTMEGLQMISVDSIISCASDSNYTVIFQKNKQKIIASRTMKDVEEILSDHAFLRVHHSYIVNINEINKYIKGEGGYLVMSDGSTVDVSRSRKEMLLKKLLPTRS